jgi:hypothetical protein
MKLTFITDQGSTLATVRCACRAERLEAFFWALRDATGGSPGAALPALTVAGGPGAAAGVLVLVPDRRKDRAGDEGEFGGRSGMSQAKAAGETVGASGLAGAVLEAEVLDEAVLEAGVPEAKMVEARIPEGEVPNGGSGNGSAAGAFSAAGGWSVSWPGLASAPAASFGRLSPDGPGSSAGRAGTPSTIVASETVPSAWPGVVDGTVSVEPAGNDTSLTPLVADSTAAASAVPAALRAARSDPLPLADVAVTGSALAVLAGLRRGTAAIMPADWVSCPLSSARSSSPPTRGVTMVGVAPPDPSGIFARLSKPSSL